MLTYSDLDSQKKAFIFELDGVLYPERDFYLQIYYLFANFIEYVETSPKATELLAFMQKVYEHHGPEPVFDRAVAAFGLDKKYRENFDRLLLTAQLPLKLELHEPVLQLLQEIVLDRKGIYIWTRGDAEGQLNKIRQVNWHGLEQYLRVYFDAEAIGSVAVLLDEHQLNAKDVIFIGSKYKYVAQFNQLEYFEVSDFLNH